MIKLIVRKKKSKALLILGSFLCLYFLLTFGIPFFIKLYIPYYLNDKYNLQISISEVISKGWQKIIFNGTTINTNQFYTGNNQLNGSIPKIEIKYNLKGYLFSGEKLIDEILISNVIANSTLTTAYSLDSQILIQCDENYEAFYFLIKGKYQGKFELTKSSNLSWQINLENIQKIESSEIWKLNGQVVDAEGGYVNIDSETMGNMIKLNLKIVNLDIAEYIKGSPFLISNQKLNLEFFLNGNLDNLKRFQGRDKYFIAQPLRSSLYGQIKNKLKEEKNIIHEIQGNYEDNKLDLQYSYTPSTNNSIRISFLVDEDNYINGKMIGDIQQLNSMFGKIDSVNKFKELSGGIKFFAKISGEFNSPEIDFQMEDQNLVYKNNTVRIKCDAISNGFTIKIPVLKIEMQDKLIAVSLEAEIKKELLVAKIIKIEAGQMKKEFRNISPIAVELSKQGITINEFILKSKQTELKSILQILPNGDGIGKIFIKGLNIKEFVDFFNLKLPYEIEGQAISEIKFNCSLTNPKIQMVGSVENFIINSIKGGDSKFDIQLDKNGIDINTFNLSNEEEKSKFTMNGFIPLHVDLNRGIFEENIHQERRINFICQNTSTALLRKIIPKVEALEGKISGELSSFKLEDNRYFLGSLTLVGGKIAFASNLAPITELEGNFLFSSEKIEVSKVNGKMGEGTFEIKGSMKLFDLKIESIDFSITGKKLKLINDDDLVVILSPTLTYTGTLDAPLLKGTLYADYGNYTENLSKLPEKINTFKSASTEYGFWPRTAIDLDVRCDNKVNNSIRQTAFYLQGSANLKFKGFIANSYMSGFVRIEKGIIPIYSKEFIVEGGSVTFEENTGPYVNLTANYRGKNIDVKMQVNQSLDDPIEPNYSSLPSYSEEDLQRYLILNMLPGQEGESFDFYRFIKTSIDYSEILSNDTLKWLKKFSFETRTRNNSGQEELGLTIEYKFEEPEWFSVKAIQDDNGVFNFFLVASKDFMGFYVDPSIFTTENFSHLEPKLIVDFTNELMEIEGITFPPRNNNEFDIQFLVKMLNYVINLNDFHKYLPEKLKDIGGEKLKEYILLNEPLNLNKSDKEKIKTIRKFNSGIIKIIFKKYFVDNLDKKIESEDINYLKGQIKGGELKRQQKNSLQNLVKDELKSYVRTNEISYLNLASKKMERVCASWGYKDALVSWEKLDKKFIDPEKTIPAVKFIIITGVRYKLKSINLKGINLEEATEVLNGIKFEPYRKSAPVYFSENYINFLKNQITEYYLQRGYLDVAVSFSGINIINNKNKEVSANIEIDKKHLYQIGNLELYGNAKFSKNEIMSVVLQELAKTHIIENENALEGYFHSVLLSKLRKHISEFYHQRGFYFVEVNSRIKSAYEYQDINLFVNSFNYTFLMDQVTKEYGAKKLIELYPNLLNLKTGEEFYYYFNQIISSSTMRWLFLQNFIKIDTWQETQIKNLFDEVKKNRDDQVEQILIRKIFTELLKFPEFHTIEENNKISSAEKYKQSIVCQISENNLYKFGKITISPRYNDDFKTQRKIIEKKITIKEGEVYNINKLKESVRNLSRLGVFQEVDYHENVIGDLISINFILRENKTLSSQVEIGYGEFERLQAGLRLFDHNIFGTTKSLGLRGVVSTKSLLIEPVFDTQAFWGFRNEWVGFYEYSDKDDFTLERIGFETNLHKTIKKNFGLSFGYKFENTTAKDLIDELDQLDVGYVNYSGVQGSFSFINIDDLLIPHRGTFFKVKGEFNSKIFGSTFDFVKSEVQVTQHLPISERVTFSIGSRFGFMKSLNSDIEIPIQTRFFSGGGNTIRGYDHNSIGPQIDGKSSGGEVRGIFNTELRFPLTISTTKQFGVVFFDAGFLEESIEKIKNPEIYTSVGVGYRLLSPIGPIRLDLGVALKNRREDDDAVNLEHDSAEIHTLYFNGYKSRLHLSFGFAF